MTYDPRRHRHPADRSAPSDHRDILYVAELMRGADRDPDRFTLATRHAVTSLLPTIHRHPHEPFTTKAHP